MHGSHTLIKIPSNFTQFLTKKLSKLYLKTPACESQHCLQSNLSQYTHIVGWKDQTSKEIATCVNLASLSSCCEQAAAGMLRPFPVHFVPLQSNSTDWNVHDSHADTENWMKCGFSYETDCWRKYCEERFWMNLDILCRCRSLTMVDLAECCMLTVHGSHLLIKIPSYLTQFLKRKRSKFHLKIPAHESHTYSTVKSVTNTFIS